MKRSLLSCLTSLVTLLCAMTAFGAQAADAAKAAPKGDAARGQAVASTVCAACHGPDGNSPLAANPKLAGQHPEYLLQADERTSRPPTASSPSA
jgi:cytochrome c553